MKLQQVKIHWAQLCAYPAFGVIEPHSHAFFHYIFVLSGSGTIAIEREVLQLRPKHMYMIPPHTRHTFRNDQQEKLFTLEIKFEYFHSDTTKKLSVLPYSLNVDSTPIRAILRNIRREAAENNPFQNEILSLNMQEIYLHIQRKLGSAEENPDRNDMSDVIEYIENNLDCDINLQDLANIVCLEKTYFLKKFKQLTGTTPMVYTRAARISKAKELLAFSDMNITQIANAVGFCSVHHFSRSFAAATGISPSKYKKEHPSE